MASYSELWGMSGNSTAQLKKLLDLIEKKLEYAGMPDGHAMPYLGGKIREMELEIYKVGSADLTPSNFNTDTKLNVEGTKSSRFKGDGKPNETALSKQKPSHYDVAGMPEKEYLAWTEKQKEEQEKQKPLDCIIESINIGSNVKISHDDYPQYKIGQIAKIDVDTEWEDKQFIGLTVIYTVKCLIENTDNYSMIQCNQYEVRRLY